MVYGYVNFVEWIYFAILQSSSTSLNIMRSCQLLNKRNVVKKSIFVWLAEGVVHGDRLLLCVKLPVYSGLSIVFNIWERLWIFYILWCSFFHWLLEQSQMETYGWNCKRIKTLRASLMKTWCQFGKIRPSNGQVENKNCQEDEEGLKQVNSWKFIFVFLTNSAWGSILTYIFYKEGHRNSAFQPTKDYQE